MGAMFLHVGHYTQGSNSAVALLVMIGGAGVGIAIAFLRDITRAVRRARARRHRELRP